MIRKFLSSQNSFSPILIILRGAEVEEDKQSRRRRQRGRRRGGKEVAQGFKSRPGSKPNSFSTQRAREQRRLSWENLCIKMRFFSDWLMSLQAIWRWWGRERRDKGKRVTFVEERRFSQKILRKRDGLLLFKKNSGHNWKWTEQSGTWNCQRIKKRAIANRERNKKIRNR